MIASYAARQDSVVLAEAVEVEPAEVAHLLDEVALPQSLRRTRASARVIAENEVTYRHRQVKRKWLAPGVSRENVGDAATSLQSMAETLAERRGDSLACTQWQAA